VKPGAPATGALPVGPGAHLLDVAVEVADAFATPGPFDLDLLLAETAARPHSPPPAPDLPVVRVCADQARQQVVQASSLDLEPAFMGARVLGKDLEDDLRPIEHPRLDL